MLLLSGFVRSHIRITYYLLQTLTIHEIGDMDSLRGHNTPIWPFDSNTAMLTSIITFPWCADLPDDLPAERHWRDWTRDTQVYPYTMDLPSMKEIEDLG